MFTAPATKDQQQQSQQQHAPSQADKDALIALVIGAFLLTSGEVSAMSDAIATAQTDALTSAYQDALDTVGVDASVLDAADVPDAATIAEIDADAIKTAQDIAATYARDLKASARGFVDGYVEAHDNSLTGAEAALRKDLAQYCHDRIGWKAAQISNAECGRGLSVGTAQAIDDILSGDVSLGEDVSLGNIMATVLPESAAEPFCESLAGNEYTLDDAQNIVDLLPAHSNCPHYVYVYVA